MPPPFPEEPGMFRLGEPLLLEGVFRAAGFLEIAIPPMMSSSRGAMPCKSFLVPVACRGNHCSIFCLAVFPLADNEEVMAEALLRVFVAQARTQFDKLLLQHKNRHP